jgi:hypothetical protein
MDEESAKRNPIDPDFWLHGDVWKPPDDGVVKQANATKGKAKRRRKRRLEGDDESDNESDRSGESYVPRPTKKRKVTY